MFSNSLSLVAFAALVGTSLSANADMTYSETTETVAQISPAHQSANLPEEATASTPEHVQNFYLTGSVYEVMPLTDLATKAKSGDANAQFFLAGRYKKGFGVEKNSSKAFKLYMAAAHQGAAPAQLNLGQMYALGTGVQRDLEQARTWFQRAAKQGDNRASYNLAILDERKQNLTDAYKWYELATRDEMLSDSVKKRARGKIVTLAMKLSENDVATARTRADHFLQDK